MRFSAQLMDKRYPQIVDIVYCATKGKAGDVMTMYEEGWIHDVSSGVIYLRWLNPAFLQGFTFDKDDLHRIPRSSGGVFGQVIYWDLQPSEWTSQPEAPR